MDKVFSEQNENEFKYIEKYMIPKLGFKDSFDLALGISSYCMDIMYHISLSSISYNLSPKEVINLFTLYVNNIIIGVSEIDGDAEKIMEDLKKLDLVLLSKKIIEVENKIGNPILYKIFADWIVSAVDSVNEMCKASLEFFKHKIDIKTVYGLFMIRFNNMINDLDLENIVKVQEVPMTGK